MAECHPVGFQWVMEAKRRGATIIHVDPRFTRTSAVADIHVPIRAGSDIAFLGGIVRYILRERALLPRLRGQLHQRAGHHRRGVSGHRRPGRHLQRLGRGERAVRHETWVVRGVEPDRGGQREMFTGEPAERGTQIRKHRDDAAASALRLPDLKRHFARYTPEMVEEVCGVPQALFLKVAEALCRNSGRERTSAFCYAVGWTQHTVGVQYIRTAAIIQLLLGNIGRPGGGILALRGHASIQGSTDIPTLYNLLPGYLPMPKAQTRPRFRRVPDATTHRASGWWSEFPKYVVSLLKAWFGDAARRGERLVLRLSALAHRRPLAHDHRTPTWPMAA